MDILNETGRNAKQEGKIDSNERAILELKSTVGEDQSIRGALIVSSTVYEFFG